MNHHFSVRQKIQVPKRRPWNLRPEYSMIVYRVKYKGEDSSCKKFMEEFKAFALRGNVMDMAVGVIIGGAFSGIVTSLTDNFINPILNLLTGGATYTMTDVAGFASSFVSAVVNFLIMALILFCLMKGINKLLSFNKKKKHRQSRQQRHVHSARVKSVSRQPAVHTVLLY